MNLKNGICHNSSNRTAKTAIKVATTPDFAVKYDVLLPIIDCTNKKIKKADFLDKYNKSIKTIGTIFAVVMMVFTNFLIDAPLTKIITKTLTDKVKTKIEEDKNIKSGGINNA